MVVAGMDPGQQQQQQPPVATNKNNNIIPVVQAAAAAATALNSQQNNQGYNNPNFNSDDPAAPALAVTEGAAMVGRMAAEISGDYVKRKRLCRFPGCTKVIKSQGHCQRHGAKAKRCKIDGCDKQAQGTHEGRCHGIIIQSEPIFVDFF